MRLLLVNPRFPESFWSFKWAVDRVLPGRRATNPPLGLATLAGLCPPDWEVSIVDENVETLPLAPVADIVGVCGMGVQMARQVELLEYYRSRGYYTVAGGSFASLCPERYEGIADCVVAGESEHLWPRFCQDFERGEAEALYREEGTVELCHSPTPRFDLLKLERYSMASVQFSRGCPYRCEFCDIIVMFGRRPRTKSTEQIGLELDALRAQGVRRVFFVDDNLIGNRAHAKALLGYLADYQARHRYYFSFGTEASLNLARDDELMRLFREAGFSWVFIGIESPDEASLKEAKKGQNMGGNMLGDIRRIYGAGIEVLAGFIVGFDQDTLETFDRQRDFIMESGIQSAMVGLLQALPRTPLYERMEREGRLREQGDDGDNTLAGSNVQPKNMDYDTMVDRYHRLYRELLTDSAIGRRIRNKRRFMRNPAYRGSFSGSETAHILWRLLTRGILPGGPRRWAAFARSMPWLSPRHMAWAISDWITGLSMADFAHRRLAVPQESVDWEGYLRGLRAALARYAAAGRAALHVATQDSVPSLSLTMSGLLDRRFFRRAERQLKRLLKVTPMRLTLRIEDLRETERRHLERLLGKLHRYGDRISIVLDEQLRQLVRVDSSVFHLVLSHAHPRGEGLPA